MATKTPTNVFKIPGTVSSTNPQGGTVVLFEKGADAYDRIQLGAELDLTFDDGTVIKAVVKGTVVGALIDLMSNLGPSSIYTYGQPYSARMVLAGIGQGEVVDTVRLYTGITVYVPPVPYNG